LGGTHAACRLAFSTIAAEITTRALAATEEADRISVDERGARKKFRGFAIAP